MKRRDFIRYSSVYAGLSTTEEPIHSITKLFSASPDSLAFSSALEAADAIKSGKTSSFELTKMIWERYDRFHSDLNAIIYPIRQESLSAAMNADKELARGNRLGPLHGVPITIKDSFLVKGTPSTWGLPFAADLKASEDATVVSRLKKAGAVILGHTNIPTMLNDHQSNNELYGRTNNPWELRRTPGGSTGGGAAALASGMTYLSIGSDIGGSIRVPATFCGLFGHKPTVDLVPMQGHHPPFPDVGPPNSYGLPVGGPLARSAEDLLAVLQIIGGPDSPENVAYSWNMPSSRAKDLKDFRIGYVLDDNNCPVSSEIRPRMVEAISAFRSAGAQLTEGWPKDMNPLEHYHLYSQLLGAFFGSTDEEDQFNQIREGLTKDPQTQSDFFMKGQYGSHNDYLTADSKRLQIREKWQIFFRDYDAFLLPCSFVPAFPHIAEQSWAKRKLETPEGDREFSDMLFWISFATLAGLPATSFPVGVSDTGLPVGMQLIGPYLEDATPIVLSGILSKIVGMPQWPQGYR